MSAGGFQVRMASICSLSSSQRISAGVLLFAAYAPLMPMGV